MIDASAFFAALFGSDQMEMFVGKPANGSHGRPEGKRFDER